MTNSETNCGGRLETILLVDDDPAIRNGLGAALSGGGRRVITCGDIESAQLVMETEQVDAVVSDVRLTGPFAFEGLDFIRIATERRPDAPFVIITGNVTEPMRREALDRGASAVLQKPFNIDELEPLLDLGAAGSGEAETMDLPSIESILSEGLTHPVFHPIHPARGGSPMGFECLTRVRSEASLLDTGFLFRYAERRKRLYEMELLGIWNAFAAAVGLPDSAKLFINLHPHSLPNERLASDILDAARANEIDPNRLVVEITEQGAIEDIDASMVNVARFRKAGVALALDGVGVAYSHLLHIERLAPSYIKISQDFGSGFETQTTRLRIVENITALARSFSCRLILEGVETRETADAARARGIDFLQGYLFGRPSPAGFWAAGPKSPIR